MEKHYNIPILHFSTFDRPWDIKQFGKLTKRISEPVDVELDCQYEQIGIRSHGKGIFYKQRIDGKSLGNKRVFWVKENVFIVNIVFAWEQAVARTTNKEIGMIASHRFPMYSPIENISNLDYLLQFFLTKKGKALLELASPGGAGRNKTLGQKSFESLKLSIPTFPEQTKIASFLVEVDSKITLLKKKKSILGKYKEGVMHQLFSQKLRFKDDTGNEFKDWEVKKLKEVLFEHKTRNKDKAINEVFSVAKGKGVINQIEHLGRSYASNETANYKVVFPNDVIYTKSPTSDFPFGIIKQNKLNRTGIVSVLYAVFTPKNKNIGMLLDFYFSDWRNTYNYLNPLVRKGAKNTINIGNEEFLNGTVISLPSSESEQAKIVNFLSAIDKKISHCGMQIEKMETWKKGLLQQMFI
jgi:type I restriction enzyme, S subunit